MRWRQSCASAVTRCNRSDAMNFCSYYSSMVAKQLPKSQSPEGLLASVLHDASPRILWLASFCLADRTTTGVIFSRDAAVFLTRQLDMKLLLTLALAPRAQATARLARYARNSTSHPGRCDRNVFERSSTSSPRDSSPRQTSFRNGGDSTSRWDKVTAGKILRGHEGPGRHGRQNQGLDRTARNDSPRIQAPGRDSSTRSRTTSPSSTANWKPASSASAIATSRVVARVSQGTTSRGGAEQTIIDWQKSTKNRTTKQAASRATRTLRATSPRSRPARGGRPGRRPTRAPTAS